MTTNEPPVTPLGDGGRAARIAFVMGELEQMRRTAGSVAAKLARGSYVDDGPARVFSFRMRRSELAALEERAEQLGVKPSVLARNLVRVGLRVGLRTGGRDDEVGPAIGHLIALLADVRGVESAVEEVRALLG